MTNNILSTFSYQLPSTGFLKAEDIPRVACCVLKAEDIPRQKALYKLSMDIRVVTVFYREEASYRSFKQTFSLSASTEGPLQVFYRQKIFNQFSINRFSLDSRSSLGLLLREDPLHVSYTDKTLIRFSIGRRPTSGLLRTKYLL